VSTSPAQVMVRLDALACELDGLSKALAETERALEPLEARYEEFVGDWEVSLWEEVNVSEIRWPPERLRLRMAHRAISAELLGSLNAAQAKRKRLEKRIGAIKVLVDSQRSILSALKEEMAATR
jgi:predicted RNase H-like nuclease (RuvC/YqgF family)